MKVVNNLTMQIGVGCGMYQQRKERLNNAHAHTKRELCVSRSVDGVAKGKREANLEI